MINCIIAIFKQLSTKGFQTKQYQFQLQVRGHIDNRKAQNIDIASRYTRKLCANKFNTQQPLLMASLMPTTESSWLARQQHQY